MYTRGLLLYVLYKGHDVLSGVLYTNVYRNTLSRLYHIRYIQFVVRPSIYVRTYLPIKHACYIIIYYIGYNFERSAECRRIYNK